MGLARGGFRHDDEGDLARFEALHALRAREDAALGGKMLDTRTRLQAAMPADRSASSNEVSFSRCFPTPLVKNISFGTNPITCQAPCVRTKTRRTATWPATTGSSDASLRRRSMVNSGNCSVKELRQLLDSPSMRSDPKA